MHSIFLSTHRRILWALIAAFSAFCAWAFLAELDIVVTAHGKLSPTHFVQVAQPSEDGIIRRVLVKDGDRVTAGQPLVELDAVFAEEDVSSAQAQRENLFNQLARIDAEIQGRIPDIPDAGVMAEFHGRRAAYQALMAEAQRQRDSAAAELMTARERLQKYEALSPVTTRQADMLARLKQSGFVSEAAHNDKLIAKIETDRERDVQARAVKAAEAQLSQTEAYVTKVRNEYHRQLTVERTEAQLRLKQADAELKKQSHRASLKQIKAPVSGVVTGLDVHTPGQVVTAGTPLLSLVPDSDPLRFEGWLKNEDAAFVFPEMAAKVKIAAYPFQKYGWIDGELAWMGVDAETPESMRSAQGELLFYRIRVTLPASSRTAFRLDEQDLELKSGMQAIADLHVGKRTLFDYLISPLRKIALEAAREK